MMPRHTLRAAVAAALLATPAVHASGIPICVGLPGNYVVNRADDVSAADGQLTLREAVQLALANAQCRTEGSLVVGDNYDHITFDLPAGTVITLDASIDTTGDSIDIDATGSGGVTLRLPGAATPFFTVANGTAFSELSLAGLTLDGQGHSRSAAIDVDDAYLLLSHVTVQDVVAAGAGNAPLRLVSPRGLYVERSLFSGNTGTAAGALYLTAPSATATYGLFLDGFIGNAGSADGGAIRVDAPLATLQGDALSVLQNTAAGDGGGLDANVAALDLQRSTFAANTATGKGGGIAMSGGTLALTSSTVSGNTAAAGGGIYASMADGVDVQLKHVTLVQNTAADTGGVYVTKPSPATGVAGTHSIVAGNHSTGDASHDDFGPVAGSGLDHSFTGADPLLNPLAWNGGPTPTHLPKAGSPVVNAGNVASLGANVPSGDQRDAKRVVGAEIDIGAVEYAPPKDTGGVAAGGLLGLLLLLSRRRRSP